MVLNLPLVSAAMLIFYRQVGENWRFFNNIFSAN